MTTDKQDSGLSAAEEAYFNSGGETPLDAATEKQEADDGGQEGVQTEAEGLGELQGDTPTRDEKGRFVPHQALHAEREEHKRTKAELAELRDFRIRMEERIKWAEEQKAQQQQQKEPEGPPDPEVDVFAALKWTQEKLLAAEKASAEARAKADQQAQQRSAEQAMWNEWESDARGYSAENKDFPNAAKWLAEYRDKQLQALSVADPRFGDVRARNAQIEAELAGIIQAAKQRGLRPAEAVYQIAQGYGYQMQAAQQAAGGLALPEQLNRVAAAQQASRTVAGSPGRAGGGELDLAAVMSMDRREFDAWYADPKNARTYDRLMGA